MPWSDEARKAAAERMRKLNADPEFAARRLAALREAKRNARGNGGLTMHAEFVDDDCRELAEYQRDMNAILKFAEDALNASASRPLTLEERSAIAFVARLKLN